jgi:hypothetical protein
MKLAPTTLASCWQLIDDMNNLTWHLVLPKYHDIQNVKPEALELITANKDYSAYFDLAQSFKIDTPFKLKKIHFDTLSSYQNYYEKLNDYAITFLQSNNIDISKAEVVKEILLTTLFKRNLSFLKQLITSKDANDLEKILILDNNGHYEIEDCGIYNNMILTSGAELNEIIKVLLYKMFDNPLPIL